MYEQELEVALDAVRRAGTLCEQVRASMVTQDTLTKRDRSPVTVADLAGQAVISHLLAATFQEDRLVAEEDTKPMQGDTGSDTLDRVCHYVDGVLPGLNENAVLAAIDRGNHTGGTQGRFWTIDPIDGTKGYIRGDQYAIALALIDAGEVVLGVLGCPHLPEDALNGTAPRGVLMAATKGGGAFAFSPHDNSRKPIHVNAIADTRQAVICQSVEAAHTSHSRASRIAERLHVAVPGARVDSQCKYAVVARGEASIYMRLPGKDSDYKERIWDHAAGCLVVTEAGGRVSDVDGNTLDFTQGRTLEANTGVIATNGTIHPAVVDAVRETLAED